MRKKIILLELIAMIVALLYGIGVLYYQKAFLPNTTINGISTAGKSVEDAKTSLSALTKEYQLTITGRGQLTDQIKAGDIDLRLDFKDQIFFVQRLQNEWTWPIACFKKTDIELKGAVLYNEEKLKECIKQLKCNDKEYVKEPVNAYISEYIPDTGFIVISEQENNTLDTDVLERLIRQKLSVLNSEITLQELESAEAYKKAEICSDDESLNKMVKEMNRLTQAEITYQLGDKKETVDGSVIAEWLKTNSKKGTVSLDKDKVREYVNDLARTYDTYDGNSVRKFQTSYECSVTIEGGDYGWWMNRTKTTEELIQAIEAGKKGELQPVYYQKAASYSDSDYGDSYVEINLTAQHLFLYKDGKKIFETDFVSGKPSIKNSPSGVYAVTYKERAHTMRGSVSDPYRVETSFWMPFAGHVGMHDAMWRKAFGGTIYKTNGSHGCINLPYNAAKTIYENIEKGFPVICYRLDGTESSTTTKQDDQEIANIAIDAIERIGTVTQNNYYTAKKKIEWARQVYRDLTAAQKKYVTNYQVLTDAEKTLRKLR